MNTQEINSYLQELGMSDVLIDRLHRLINEFSPLMVEEPESIFVSEYVDNEGKRHYTSMGLFSRNYLWEAKRVENEENMDMAYINNKVTYVEITKADYDFKEAGIKSRLNVKYTTGEDLSLSGELRASGKNCDVLRNVASAHLIGNFVGHSDSK